MLFLSGNLLYDFNVENINDQLVDSSSDEFLINFRFRKSNASNIRRSLQIPRTSQQFGPIMSDLLGDYDVPARPKSDMSAHFKFFLERLNRFQQRGVSVAVNLEEKSIPPERADAKQSRIVEGRRESVKRRVVDEAAALPTNKEAVAALERRRVTEDEEERECVICSEKLEEGVEVIKMPCLHKYHNKCLIPWLFKNHFCPFCRFQLPR
ncbi:hypothetical protein RND81_06G005900 [Saponaria officinalis]|uniref:RING-type E3 ubiquitin transferase n=1 Tax=Saponaria officinalis TaxID=3572 RepID=A0AAW1K567_SAPOF